MNEEFPSAVAINGQVEQSDVYGPETVDDWYRPLFNLVVANAGEVRKWSWMSGAEAPLSNAMWEHPGVSEESVSEVISDILNSLTSPNVEVKKPEEKEIDEDTNQVEQLKTEIAEVEAQVKNEASQTEQTESSVSASETDFGGQIQVKSVAETTTNVLNNSRDIAIEDDVKILETAEPASSVAQRPSPEKIVAQTSQESPPLKAKLKETKPSIKPAIEPEVQLPVSVVPEVKTAKNSTSKISPTPSGTRPIAEQEFEPKAEEEQLPELYVLANPVKATELREEKIEAVAADTVDVTSEPITKIMIDKVEEIGLNSIEPGAFSIPMWEELEATIELEQEPVEVIDPEQLFRISVEPEEIEDVLLQLAENIENSEPEIAEELNEILNKIIEVPAMIEAAGENSFSEADAQEKLEELFIELFELAGIDYTPEVIESLARLIINNHLAEEVVKLKKEETGLASQGIGTHEIIRKLLAFLSLIKKVITHAGAIGKSALRLYSLSFYFG